MHIANHAPKQSVEDGFKRFRNSYNYWIYSQFYIWVWSFISNYVPPFGMLSFSLFALSNYLILIGLYAITSIFAYNRDLHEKMKMFSNQTKFFLDSSTALKNDSILKSVLSIVNNSRNEIRVLTEMDITPSRDEINKYVDQVITIINQIKEKGDTHTT